ncbi:MAG: box helicase protein, partial [Verrucomicrobiales bacterium]|nr:box helicase protein [Verrucomicrobiales bacterium]
HSPTGTGKTYSVWGGPLEDWLGRRRKIPKSIQPFKVLWITPLRALANDTLETLKRPIADLGIPWTVGIRTGDTSSQEKRKQRSQLPTALITTPESLSVMLSYPEAHDLMNGLELVVMDEWHDLLGTKRGVQAELCLARLRHWFPTVRTWALSATLGNLDQAMEVPLGSHSPNGKLVSGDLQKKVEVETVLPLTVEKFPWAGHLGLQLLPDVLEKLNNARTTLVFTNTRSQTEIWFQELIKAKPEWKDLIGIHHGSIDRHVREEVEEKLRTGGFRCVVCTASLDLGVDFSPVEQVIQIGAPKGVARMLQRAGRSGHRPGATSRIVCIPAHALELVEFAAVKEAIEARTLEAREPLENPLDVLVQHIVTISAGIAFDSESLYHEVKSAYAFRNLTPLEWEWCLGFVSNGGKALKAYPQYNRVVHGKEGWKIRDESLAQLHRMSIGTITSDSSLLVRYVGGKSIGSVEESFLARVKPGQSFSFAGYNLELVRIRDLTAYVRKSAKVSGAIPQWMGGRMPLSSQLAAGVRRKFSEVNRGQFNGIEMETVRPVLEIQKTWSHIPEPDELLIEKIEMHDGGHYFIFPFAGRLVHEGLSALLAFRVSRLAPRSISTTVNDYGFGLLATSHAPVTPGQWCQLLSPENLLDDLLACLNSAELARRQFREIARIAGLIFQGFPGSNKTVKQLQASSGLIFEVFTKYDPDNLLLSQARLEVMDRQLDISRLKQSLSELAYSKIVVKEISRLTPLSFPLWASFVQAQVNSESYNERIKRMALQLEADARKEN